MQLPRCFRSRPVLVLGSLAFAFAAWVVSDSFRAKAPEGFVEVSPDDMKLVGIVAPELGWTPPKTEDKPRPSPQDTALVLHKLKPGMTRVEVEVLVGAPEAHDILPAHVYDGKVTYFTAYEADLAPPATVRPIRTPRPNPMGPRPDPTDRTLVTLEFDATKPGHPLLGVHYPDPLF